MSRIQNDPLGLRGGSAPRGHFIDLDASVNASFFTMVYAWMAAGLAVTGAFAFAVANVPAVQQWALNGPALIVSFLVEIGLVIAISRAINRISAPAAIAMFLLYSAVNGFVLSVLFLTYTHSSLAGTFVITAGAFGATSVYGHVTQRDLTRLGSLLFMALIGLIIASLVNLFMHSPFIYWLTTYAGVLIFVGLTAYDTQQLKGIAMQTGNDPRLAARFAVVGSLVLYLDFINLFLLLLRLMGNRRSN